MVFWGFQICLVKGEKLRKKALYSSFVKKKSKFKIYKNVKANVI